MATVNRSRGRRKKETAPHPMDGIYDELPKAGQDRWLLETIRRYKDARGRRSAGVPEKEAESPYELFGHPGLHLPLGIGDLAVRKINLLLDQGGSALIEELEAAGGGNGDLTDGRVIAKLWEIMARPSAPTPSN